MVLLHIGMYGTSISVKTYMYTTMRKHAPDSAAPQIVLKTSIRFAFPGLVLDQIMFYSVPAILERA
jgi:hypothetical protein